jgi:lipopolysaccharide/colanic/teichoic acid biosynthesis glycosyltransferase
VNAPVPFDMIYFPGRSPVSIASRTLWTPALGPQQVCRSKDHTAMHLGARPPTGSDNGRTAASNRSSSDVVAMISAAAGLRKRIPLWKRAIDVAGSVVALPILAVCTLVMAILTRCVSPGPVFFKQERIGHMGRRFKIYKFRTMKMGSDCTLHKDYWRKITSQEVPMAKLDDRGDSRLIPAAWILRALGLDELPQLINVLRGEMSLVGPRPCLPSEFEQFVAWQRRRCEALPGLTGLWQVSGKNRTTFKQMICFDLQYARRLSLWLDLKIILMTVPCLLAQVFETRLARKSLAKQDSRALS